MVHKRGQVNSSLWVSQLLFATILTSESLPDLGFVDISEERHLKTDISKKSLWKRGTYRFQGDPQSSPDRVNPTLGFLPEDIQWLQGTLDDEFFWSTPSQDGRELWTKNFTIPKRHPDPGFRDFPDYEYWIEILFKNVPEELNENLIHDLSSRLERAHEFAFKRRQDAYPDLVRRGQAWYSDVTAVEESSGTNVPHMRRARATLAVDVTILKIAKEAENEVEAVYCLQRNGKPVLSKSAVLELNEVTEDELDFIFSPYSVARLTHESSQAVTVETEERSSPVLPIITVVTVALVVLAVALFVYRYKKRSQDIIERHWHEQEAPSDLHCGLKARRSRRVDPGDAGRSTPSQFHRYDEQVAMVELGFDPGESDDGHTQQTRKAPSTSQESEDTFIPTSDAPEEEKRPNAPPRTKRSGAVNPAFVTSSAARKVSQFEDPADDFDSNTEATGSVAEPESERPRSSYRGAIISDVSSSSTTTVKPTAERVFQIHTEAWDGVGVESGYYLIVEPDGEEGILRMKRRFHAILDDAFKAFSPSDVDLERDTKTAVAQLEFEQSEDKSLVRGKRVRSAETRANFDRPEKARPISALLGSGQRVGDKNVVTITVPPKCAWESHQYDPRFDVDVQASGSQFIKGRSNAPPPSPEPIFLGGSFRSYEPMDPESGLQISDPTVSIIAAIKEELEGFSNQTVSPTPGPRYSAKPKSQRRVHKF